MEQADSKLIRVCRQSEIPAGGAQRITVEGMPPLAVFNIDGEIFITDDTCTHGYASLAEGVVDGDIVECPLHGGCFEIRTGRPVSFPVVHAIRTYSVRIIDGDVFIDVA
jgi:nitrite reductase/ring-hydroxylating ferredoxin subunit